MPVSKKRKKPKIQKEKSKKKDVIYICTECESKEEIPFEVVRTFDELDQSNINEPPQFNCESCGGLMRPESYKSIHGILFEYRKDSE